MQSYERMPDRQAIGLAVFLAGSCLYLAVFFLAGHERGAALLTAFIPDQVLLAWVGGDPSRIGLTDRLLVLAAAGGLLGLAAACGYGTLALARSTARLTRLETLVFSTATGLGELSLLTLLWGLAGAIDRPWLLRLTLLSLAAAGVWNGYRRRKKAAASTTRAAVGMTANRVSSAGTAAVAAAITGTGAEADADAQPAADAKPRFPRRYGLWLALPFLGLIVLGGMMPPWEFDVREYHLQVPKEWFLAGQIEFLPHNVYGNMPLGAEMHALLAMILLDQVVDWWWGAIVGKTVMAAFAPLTALALYAAGRRFGSAAGGAAAGLIYLSTPWVIYVAMTGLNEGAVACYSLLAVYALLLGRGELGSSDPAGQAGNGTAIDVLPRGSSADRSEVRGHCGLVDRLLAKRPRSPKADASKDRRPSSITASFLLLAGFFAGSAAACKYPALLFTVVPLFVWCLLGHHHRRWQPAALFLLAAMCAVGPWYAKNAVFTGNPVYPLVFGGRTRTPERMQQWNRAHRVPPDERGRRYSGAQAVDAIALLGWQSRWISPLLLPFALMAALARRSRRVAARLVALLALAVAVWWLATHRVDRFLVPVLPWAAWLAGIGFAWCSWRSWRRIAGGLLLAGLSFNFLYLVSGGHSDPRLLVALADLRRDEPREDQPSRVSPVHRYLNGHVPPGQRVLLVGDAQPFDLEVDVLYNTCFDQCLFERLMRGRTRPQRIAALTENRISHIYFDWSELARYRSPGNYGYSDYVTRQRVWEELVHRQQLLRKVPLDLDPRIGELFEVLPASADASPDVRPAL